MKWIPKHHYTELISSFGYPHIEMKFITIFLFNKYFVLLDFNNIIYIDYDL